MAFEAIRDEEGKIIDFEWLLTNPTACTLVGKSESELIGNRLLEVIRGNASDGLFDEYVKVVKSGKPLQTEFYYQHEGIDSWFKIIAVKLNNGFAVTFSNVTALKESEKALQQANQELEKQINTLQQRNQEMLLLSEMSDFLQTCLTVEEACLAIADLIQPLFPGCDGSLFLRNSVSTQIEKIVSWGKDFNQQQSFAVEDCWGLRRGRSHWIHGNRLKLCCNHIGSIHFFAGSLCIPLLALGKTLGLLYLSAEQEEFLRPDKQQLARMVGEQIASVIANLQLRATLEYQSIRDPLTGLYNRRHLDVSLPKVIELAQQQQQPVGIIMLDIDYFRSINNNYGHEGGDYVLQSVGKLLQDIGTESNALVCRYGGEEITLILSGFNLGETSNLAQTIRQAMANLRVDYNGLEINLTASLGVACFPDHGYLGTSVLREADKALLHAKENGRNQVAIALQFNSPLS
jgi:diguanylate cyclase (GGDEF)-like protein